MYAVVIPLTYRLSIQLAEVMGLVGNIQVHIHSYRQTATYYCFITITYLYQLIWQVSTAVCEVTICKSPLCLFHNTYKLQSINKISVPTQSK